MKYPPKLNAVVKTRTPPAKRGPQPSEAHATILTPATTWPFG
jgi:hypothetical protein